MAGAVGTALALAPDWTFLEPDWVGVLFAVAGAGAALWPRRAAVAGMAGGALLVLSAAVKITTAHEQHDPVNVHGQRTDRAPANTPGRERLSQT